MSWQEKQIADFDTWWKKMCENHPRLIESGEFDIRSARSSWLHADTPWRTLALRLWPFIRFWGLCGACLEAIEAMRDMADMLGEQTPLADNTEVRSKVREEVVEDVLKLLDEKWLRRVAPNERERFREEIASIANQR